ncbi:MAG: hypothetical protein V1660_03965 [archaeon]
MKLRKIITAEEKAKSEKSRNIAIGLVLVALMVASTWGYAINREDQTTTMKYNGFIFTNTENGWELKSPSLLTRFNPKEVEPIASNIRLRSNDFAGTDMYLDAYNMDEKAAAYEIARNLAPLRIQSVCLEGNENKTGCEELPIKNCYDHKVLVVREIKSEENITIAPRVYQQANCLIVESSIENLTMVADRAVFALQGIM